VRRLIVVGLAATACGSEPEPCQVGMACVWAGTGERGFNIDDPQAHRLESKLYFPVDLVFGPDDRAYINDWNNHRIRRVEPNGSLRVVIGTDYEGDGPPEMEDRLPICAPAGAPATRVAMNHTTDLEFGPDGLLYVAAWHNYKIRVFDPATGIMKVVAGNGEGFAGDGGPACQALFDQPKALAFDDQGVLYTVDQRNVRIRAIQPEPSRTISTIAGNGTPGKAGDGEPATAAEFGFDTNISPEPSGSLAIAGRILYVADTVGNRIRRIDLDSGLIDCIAGTSDAGFTGDGGPALDATFNAPTDIELGPDGRLYVADRRNHAVRAIDLATGTVDTVVGTGAECDTFDEACEERAPARELRLNQPYGIAFDRRGTLYVADTHNQRVISVPLER
jgi:hypothetical protein